MARLAYECVVDLKSGNSSDGSGPCRGDNFCLYCCCVPHCCLLLQRNSPKHFWEAWYFWLGVALLILFIVSSISSYIISNCRHGIRTTRRPSNQSNRPDAGNTNEISIHVIPTTGVLASHRKLLLCAPEPGASLMTPIVA